MKFMCCRRWRNRHHQIEGERLLHSHGKLSSCAGHALLTVSQRQSVHAATRKTLLKIKGFSEVKVEKVKEAVAKCLVSLTSINSLFSVKSTCVGRSS